MSSSDLSISGMKSLRISIRLECFGFVDGVHQLAVRPLQVALDVVVFEIVDGLGLNCSARLPEPEPYPVLRWSGPQSLL